jgi:hypothetical protein
LFENEDIAENICKMEHFANHSRNYHNIISAEELGARLKVVYEGIESMNGAYKDALSAESTASKIGSEADQKYKEVSAERKAIVRAVVQELARSVARVGVRT